MCKEASQNYAGAYGENQSGRTGRVRNVARCAGRRIDLSLSTMRRSARVDRLATAYSHCNANDMRLTQAIERHETHRTMVVIFEHASVAYPTMMGPLTVHPQHPLRTRACSFPPCLWAGGGSITKEQTAHSPQVASPHTACTSTSPPASPACPPPRSTVPPSAASSSRPRRLVSAPTIRPCPAHAHA